VAAIGQFQQLCAAASAWLNAPDLLQRAVLVVQPLHGQQRAGDGGDLVFDAPLPEGRMQPDVVPAPEGGMRSRSLKRWILPVAVLGRSATNSIWRGYL
jgi:hypothetical protein